MRREPSQLRGRIIISIITIFWLIVTIVFGFVIDKPTSSLGLSMIIIFVIFILSVAIWLIFSRYKNRKAPR